MSSAPPLAAVVTPVYNGAAFLAEAMDAVQAQTYPNLVHIVLDNASTDTTPAILERYRDARIPVRTSRNAQLLPLNANWNAATCLVPDAAKYFRILPADDLMAPDFIARTVDVAERNSNVGVVGTLMHNSGWGTFDSNWPEREVWSGREALRRHLTRESCLPSLHTLFRRSLIEPGAELFPVHLAGGDIAAVMGVLTKADLGMVHADLATTRIHEGSVTSVATHKQRRYQYEWFYLLERFAPQAFEPDEARAIIKLYRRGYLRRLLRGRIVENDIYRLHREGLDRLGVKLDFADFVDALTDYVHVRLGRRSVWQGYPLYGPAA
ncbi:MAG: glycosyltransferase [Alphaproteobacteria bacterium]